MNGRRTNQKVLRMKKRRSVWLGALLLFFAVYLLIIFIQSLTREHISIYEVTEKQIADDETIRGIILRDEALVTAEKSGFINYYVGEGAKVGAKTNIYSLDETGTISERLSALDTGDVTISAEDTKAIRDHIAGFRENFDLSDYSRIQNFRYDLDNAVLQMSTISLTDRLNQIMKEEGEDTSFQVMKAQSAGIISFCSDGLENLTVKNLTAKHFEGMVDHWDQLRSSDKVKSGSPVYKIVKNENWSIVIPLTDEQHEKIQSEATIPVTLMKDDLQLTVPVSTLTIQGKQYAKLDFDQYMIRYLDNRYLDVRIEFNRAEGLKIPVSSILKKKCYVIPKAYLTQGSEEGGGGTGVFVRTYDKNGNPKKHFQTTEVYYIDDNDNVYIDTALFDPGTILIPVGNQVTLKTMEISTVRELEGVYNCNQGYCRFQIIDKLYENDEYAIVKNNTIYGLSTYDHIILNPDMIGENDIIY